MTIPPMPFSGEIEIEDNEDLSANLITTSINERCREYGEGYYPVSISVIKL